MAVTRLAPSPTGALHLGNARTFLINWLLARQNNWKIILRIEDLDGPRIKHGVDAQAINDLQWLGLNWDEGPIYQSSRIARYRAAIDKLVARGLAYPCVCTRREIDLAASAPHADDGATIYPGTCRNRFGSIEEARKTCGREPALRFRVSDNWVTFDDEFAGPQKWQGSRELGDFVIAKADGTPAYQLAVVVDDAEMGVTHVVRGDDLLDSTPRQILLYRATWVGAANSEVLSLATGGRAGRTEAGEKAWRYSAGTLSPKRSLSWADSDASGALVGDQSFRAGGCPGSAARI